MPDTTTPATHERKTDTGDSPDLSLYIRTLGTLKALGLVPHHRSATGTEIVTAPDANGLAASKTLCQALFVAFYDATTGHATNVTMHDVLDPIPAPAAYVSAPAEPVDLAETQAATNEMKLDFIAHQASSVFHIGVGGVPGGLATSAFEVITAPDGISLITTENLLNELKVWYNTHASIGLPEVSDPQP